MRKEFVKYLLTKPDVFLRVWAYVFSLVDENGLAVITKKSVQVEMLRYGTTVSRPHLDRIFDADTERARYATIEFKKKLISDEGYGNSWNAQNIEVQFISESMGNHNTGENPHKTAELAKIQFVAEVSGEQKTHNKTALKNENQLVTMKVKQRNKKEKTEKTTEVAVIQYNTGSAEQPKALIITEGIKGNLSNWKIPRWMMFSIIDKYKAFYRNLQEEAAIINRIPNFKAVDPPLSYGEAGRHIRRMVLEFIKMGANDGDQILRCFERIFDNWQMYPDSIRNYVKLAQIDRNLENIIILLQTNRINNNKNYDRSRQIASNIEKTGSKDYSNLVRKGKKDS